MQFVHLKSFPTLFIYKNNEIFLKKRSGEKQQKQKLLKKEILFYYQKLTKFVGHLNFITDFKAFLSILEFHACLFLFYITFQQFSAFYKIVLNLLQKKNLKGVGQHQDSHFISTLLQLCFFCAKSKVCFLIFSQQENSSFSHFVVLLHSLQVFFLNASRTNKSF